MFGFKKILDRMNEIDARDLEFARKRAKETGVPLIEIDVSKMSFQEIKGAIKTVRQIRNQKSGVKV